MRSFKSALLAFAASALFASPLALAQTTPPAPAAPAAPATPATPAPHDHGAAAPAAPAIPASPATEAARPATPAQAEPTRQCRTRKAEGEDCACRSAPDEIGKVETSAEGQALCVVRPAA